jgi:geranylgeranyl diphosphate synthase type II
LFEQDYYEVRKKLLEKHLDTYLTPNSEYPNQLHEAIRYSVFSEGKRLRPFLMFSAFEMLKGRKNIKSLKNIIPAACAIEMVHTASLIHDDLPSVDNSDERRGKESCHIKFGVPTALLAGDALLTKSFEILTDISPKNKAISCITAFTYSVSTRGMIAGQTVDITSTNKRININILKYIHLKKTGALLQLAMDIACIMADVDENVKATLGNFALNVGLAYQIIDDILDEIGGFEDLGKEPGQDIKNKKATYPGLIGLEKSKKEAGKLLNSAFKMIKGFPNNDILLEFVQTIKDRLP